MEMGSTPPTTPVVDTELYQLLIDAIGSISLLETRLASGEDVSHAAELLHDWRIRARIYMQNHHDTCGPG